MVDLPFTLAFTCCLFFLYFFKNHRFHFRFTSTELRKLAATLVSSVLPKEDRADLSNLMLHSEHTQQASYNQLQSSLKNIRISNILYKILTGRTITGEDMKEKEDGRVLLLLNYIFNNLNIKLKAMVTMSPK